MRLIVCVLKTAGPNYTACCKRKFVSDPLLPRVRANADTIVFLETLWSESPCLREQDRCQRLHG